MSEVADYAGWTALPGNVVWEPRILQGDPETPPLVFPTITADPPWKEQGAGKVKRGADRHYDLMDREDILRTMLRAPVWNPADNCHLYLWVTNNFLADGLWLMEALGFNYKTNVVWAKRRFGIGFYFRGQHELCLFGTRGLVQRTQRADISSLITADHGRDATGKIVHSRKPVEFYEMVEARSPGPFLEMFARTTRPGWASWGNQVPS